MHHVRLCQKNARTVAIYAGSVIEEYKPGMETESHGIRPFDR
ncbi:MAG: hypothetical protein RLZZ245_1614 [Verrucomicrobiota bacterium]